MENGPFEDVFPIEIWGFSMSMLVYQGVPLRFPSQETQLILCGWGCKDLVLYAVLAKKLTDPVAIMSSPGTSYSISNPKIPCQIQYIIYYKWISCHIIFISSIISDSSLSSLSTCFPGVWQSFILKQFGEPTRFDPILRKPDPHTSLPTAHILPQVSDRLFSFLRPDDGTVVKLGQL